MILNFLGLTGLALYFLMAAGSNEPLVITLLIGLGALFAIYGMQSSAFRHDNTLKCWREQAIEGLITGLYMLVWVALTHIGTSTIRLWYVALVYGVFFLGVLVMNLRERLRYFHVAGTVLGPKERLALVRLPFIRN